MIRKWGWTISRHMLRVLLACAAGEVQRQPQGWRDGAGRPVGRQLAALRRRKMLASEGTALTYLGWRALEDATPRCHVCREGIHTEASYTRRYLGAEDAWVSEHNECSQGGA